MEKVGFNAFKYLVKEENYNKNILSIVYNNLLSKHNKDDITMDMLKIEFKKKKREMFNNGHSALRYLVEEEGYDRNIAYKVYMDLSMKNRSENITIDSLEQAIKKYTEKEEKYTGYAAYKHLIEDKKLDKIQVYKAFSKLLKDHNNDEKRITLDMLKNESEDNPIIK